MMGPPLALYSLHSELQPVDPRASGELKVGTPCLFESPCIFSLCLPKGWTMFLEESLVTEKGREVQGSMM